MLLVKTYVAPSPIHGMGLFAAEPIARGTVIWRLEPALDLLLESAALARLAEASRAQVMRYTYLDMVLGRHVLCGDDARFMNHSERPTCHDVNDAAGGFTVAARDIAPGEELTSDYASFYAEGVRFT